VGGSRSRHSLLVGDLRLAVRVDDDGLVRYRNQPFERRAVDVATLSDFLRTSDVIELEANSHC
jgi:hypothetical protein